MTAQARSTSRSTVEPDGSPGAAVRAATADGRAPVKPPGAMVDRSQVVKAPHHPTGLALAPQLPSAIVASATLLALLAVLFFDFFRQQVEFAFTQPSDWGHTLVIPLIAGYFVYLRREALLSQPFKTTWIGLVPIVVGIGWYMTCVFGSQVLKHHNLWAAGLGTTLFGLILLFFGWRAMAILWFPLVYLVLFGQTISDRFMQIVTFRLQDITAVGSGVGLSLLGLDVERNGNILEVFSKGKSIPLNIAEACSGMRMLMAFLALGVAMAYTGLSYFWQRAALVLMGVPTAIFVNILRVMTLALLSMINPGLAGGDFHSFIGLVWLVPAFLIYLGVVWVLQRMIVQVKVKS